MEKWQDGKLARRQGNKGFKHVALVHVFFSNITFNCLGTGIWQKQGDSTTF